MMGKSIVLILNSTEEEGLGGVGKMTRFAF